MFKNKKLLLMSALILLMGGSSYAADHLDGPTVMDEPSLDITDIYAWMEDSDTMNLIMNVHPLADSDSKFSDAAQYVFRVNSSAAYGSSQTETLVICTFDTAQNTTCRIDNEVVVFVQDASATAGVSNSDNTFKVFTGLRNDPFFFDLENFNLAREAVRDAAGGLTFDAANCPTDLPPMTRDTLVNTITGSAGGLAGTNVPGVDFFENGSLSANVLSIVIQMDTSLFSGDGPVYSVSGSTNRR